MEKEMKYCCKCGKKVNGDAEFCRFCGFQFNTHTPKITASTKFCRKCGKQINSDAQFCRFCGFSFGAQAQQNQGADIYGSANTRVRQGGYNVPPNVSTVKRSGKGIVAAVLVCAIIITGIIWPGWIRGLFIKPYKPEISYSEKKPSTENSSSGKKTSIPQVVNEVSVSINESGVAKDEASGVSVDFTEFIDLEDVNQVQISNSTESYVESEDGYATVYEITAGNLHELDGWIDIRIPYSTDKVESGEDPTECVGAMYYNENTMEWEPVLYEVDESSQELIISTDHLSKFAAFQFVNAGKRMARVTSVNTKGLMFTEEESEAILREIQEAQSVEFAKQRMGETAEMAATRVMVQKINDSILNAIKKAAPYAMEVVEDGSALNDVNGPLSDTFNALTLNIGAFSDELRISVGGVGMEKFDNSIVMKGVSTVYNCYGKVCTGLAILGMINAAAKQNKTSADKLLLMKDVGMFLMGQKTSAGMGLCLTGANIIFWEISTMGQAVIDQVTDDMRKVYRWYMETENRYHGKPRTLKQWYKKFSKIIKTYGDDPEAAQYFINDAIDEYCNEFWKLEGSEAWWEIVDINGQAGRGAPAQYMRDQITAEYREELLSNLTAVFNKIEMDQEKKVRYLINEELRNATLAYSKELHVIIQEELTPDQNEYQYAGWKVRFAPLNNVAITKSWQGTLDGNGYADIKMTIIGYLLAGAPNRIDMWSPESDPDIDPPDHSEPLFLVEETTSVTLKGQEEKEEQKRIPIECDMDVTQLLDFMMNSDAELNKAHFSMSEDGDFTLSIPSQTYRNWKWWNTSTPINIRGNINRPNDLTFDPVKFEIIGKGFGYTGGVIGNGDISQFKAFAKNEYALNQASTTRIYVDTEEVYIEFKDLPCIRTNEDGETEDYNDSFLTGISCVFPEGLTHD